ncbi:MFS transporter [Lentzea sp.]|uniref:MFS transporter n=1 Tax=Lentzea sp. TaxID=56099 RepID=UPI002CAC361C|nr:MFS transporter [Lentzea sp.]HUQ55152.1 MFS transporter [Lentzea sp.]
MSQVDEVALTALRRARTALAIAFAVKGVAFAAMIARVPAIRDTLGLSSGQLGLLLLCFSGGAIAGLPIAGPVVHRVGATPAVVLGGAAVGAGLGVLGAGLVVASVPLAAAGLITVGLGNGLWDVAINVEGVDIERHSGTPLLPGLHAVFSIGTIAGAGIGAACAAAGIPLFWQLFVLAVVVPAVLTVVSRRFLTARRRMREAAGKSGLLVAWREPRTLMIGLLVLGFAFTEGSANDWIAIAFVDGYRVGETFGAVAYAVFVTAVTIGRLTGGWALRRYGRASVLRASAAVALLGLLLVLFGGATVVAVMGALLWGLGAALGFPVGISAAGDGDPARSAARVSVVSSLGYTAFLAGPPVLGLLASEVGILNALLLVPVALMVAFVAASATKAPPER